MKLKAAISNAAPETLSRAFGDREFVTRFLTDVVGEILGAQNPLDRPAEYYVQEPDRTVAVTASCWGVELRLTGVSRNGRKASQFHKALAKLHALATVVIQTALTQCDAHEPRVQLFCVVMLDGDIETAPGSGVYSNTLESEATWITKPKD